MLEDLITGFNLLTAIKLAFLIINAIYIGFLLVVLKQSRAMQKVISDGGASSLVTSVAFLHVIAAISIFVAALIIL
jgi:hypothetical protein